MATQWKFPACDDVVMNLLEDELDTSLVWVGSWEPPQEVVDQFVAVAIVTDNGYNTIDETRWATVEIEVEAGSRADAKKLAAEISSLLNGLPGESVRGILVDDVAENEGPRMVGDIDRSKRAYTMLYSLAFRKQIVEGD
ncbi:hypothetical protein [Corynebacterium accolens]|uniref:hypothetical protein n=1 Tax=Corynebacterium accolens TaxID=38284 RepID=UPI0026703319|nr:hypothetical protein [Corynebacterium accolens]WKS54904.1 hypothetical protein NLL31_06645 [Corynebacterium accolens]